MNELPLVSEADFRTKRGKSASHIMAFDNGQKVYCYGYEGKKDLVDKCENYYLERPNISKYEIHTNPLLH